MSWAATCIARCEKVLWINHWVCRLSSISRLFIHSTFLEHPMYWARCWAEGIMVNRTDIITIFMSWPLPKFPFCGIKVFVHLVHSFNKYLFFFFFFFFFKFYPILKLHTTALALPNIKMNPPQVYMCSPSRTLLPPPYSSTPEK